MPLEQQNQTCTTTTKKKSRSSPNNTTQRIASWQLPITSTHQKWWWPLYQPPVSSSIESRRRHSQREATSRARRRRRSRRWRRIAPCGWGETLAWRGRWRRHGARRSPWTATSTKPSWNLPPSPGGWKMAMVADKPLGGRRRGLSTVERGRRGLSKHDG